MEEKKKKCEFCNKYFLNLGSHQFNCKKNPKRRVRKEVKNPKKREIRVNVRFTKREYDDWMQYVESKGTKFSSFIRDAINEKKERLENPIEHTNVGVNKEVMKMFRDMQDSQKKLNQRLDNRNVVLQGIKERFNHMNGKKENDYSSETETIRNFFTTYQKEHHYVKQISASDIITGTGLNQKTVMYVLQNGDLFEQKGKGWVMK
ncbi:hypothetical protein LCGC14_2148550 [marine sediment metagenome]|uniref:Uncharacterized protein n=1 Tax=marine sediment metagenome TaxID=412755 RepID=A0A0F9EIE8_9ZZZZ